ncbi:hypothetical protein [Catenuloplanes atrovinosus]|uniref:Uncharacterized protein n=1 Tax=Catenuloplanes atrovinosus TaxID=137266 RepID=A0AAE3YRP8_9ACTN|nr:hypothetical protein [Catenuloplanes atrovinosus]MDR7277119.1 hypothetical protein [Catenuloplanes atrovinosus]
MFRRRKVVQDETVARYMRSFFRNGVILGWPTPEAVATSYGEFIWHRLQDGADGRGPRAPHRSRFSVNLSAPGDSALTFTQLTKRVSLVSDTLLLTHDKAGPFRQLGFLGGDSTTAVATPLGTQFPASTYDPDGPSTRYGMYCPDLAALGQWILDFKPLLKAGLAWYVPTYSILRTGGVLKGATHTEDRDFRAAVDFLVADGRAVDGSGADPIKSQFVRPILEIDLPFIEGVDARTFSKVTIGEFGAYSAFRDYLRRSLLEMDDSLNAVQSEREMIKLGLEIKDQIRAVRADMRATRRKRVLDASGAVVGSSGAMLVAVYGPALAAVVTAIGAGSVWTMLHAAAQSSPRVLGEDAWYYVWVLAKRSNTHTI